MKKHTLILIITLLTASDSISQISKDSTCLSNEQLKKVINRLEFCKVSEEELKISKELIQNLNQKISIKDSVISLQKIEISQNKSLINNYKETETNLNSIINNQNSQIKLLIKSNRRQKLSKFVGVALGLGLGYFISK